ncbi:phosphoribosylamine--glycine ligase [Dehalobacterium formicoaceticum]|uniref:Phosphoribosylamine--glycine ligase n=1 Tax=Dehalobacterium formicoaceticum TaxID=51515 RepID=A0ABT1Y2F6_9FIRM|nr:phosphoribosylamine--glycine ligase [Dehalobacterium formicoaceticum]MCR6544733.1 phosphoribosylamine--glycine ligase [Dehalobacterium formicoaceticum]
MKVLVVGGGGREHALVWKLIQSPKVNKVFCAPGNAGISQMAECIEINAEDIEGLLSFAKKEKIDLTVVGPEIPLTNGIVNQFQAAGLKIFGPSKEAAEIEGSKALAKRIMGKYQIPTAQYQVFEEAAPAIDYIRKQGAPIVVKADGLAAGKGVIVAPDEETAVNAVQEIMENKVFGQAGTRVVIEEFLEGEEVSILAFTDGEHVIPMISAQDHKRVFNDDQGPNTGGMGAYAPAPVYTPELAEDVLERIIKPTVAGLKSEGRTYQGVLYVGLMLTGSGPKVLEYNARFGDPETQPVMMLLKTDLVDIIQAILAGELSRQEILWYDEAAVCVVLASGGYPGSYEKGMKIQGLGSAQSESMVFHAGTSFAGNDIVTSGGRVLGVTAKGNSVAEAIKNAYREVDKISFQGMHYRTDIGKKALDR